jgi:hypothetical protein
MAVDVVEGGMQAILTIFSFLPSTNLKELLIAKHADGGSHFFW